MGDSNDVTKRAPYNTVLPLHLVVAPGCERQVGATHNEHVRVGYIVCLLPISSQDTMPERLRGLIRNQLCSHAWVRIPVVSPFFVLLPRTPMIHWYRLHVLFNAAYGQGQATVC